MGHRRRTHNESLEVGLGWLAGGIALTFLGLAVAAWVHLHGNHSRVAANTTPPMTTQAHKL